MLIILTGKKHTGKTEAVTKLTRTLTEHEFKVCGFVSKAVFEGQERIGYDDIDLTTGDRFPLLRKQPLAGVRDQIGHSDHLGRNRTQNEHVSFGERTGQYVLLAEGKRRARKALRRDPNCSIRILDEIGPLEVRKKGGFWSDFLKILGGASVTATAKKSEDVLITVVREDLLDELLARVNCRHIKIFTASDHHVEKKVLNFLFDRLTI